MFLWWEKVNRQEVNNESSQAMHQGIYGYFCDYLKHSI